MALLITQEWQHWINSLRSHLKDMEISYGAFTQHLKQYYEVWWERKKFTFHFISSYIYVMTLVVTM